MNLIELSEINVNIKLRSAAQPCYRLPAPARFESFRICRTTNASVYTAINPDTASAIEPISSRLSGQRVNTSQMRKAVWRRGVRTISLKQRSLPV